jgi:hypothetical protein
MQIHINFEETYQPLTLSDDLMEMTFASQLTGGESVQLVVQITPHPDPLLPDVYNLGFGPPDGKGGFDDNVRLKHVDIDKVFSTVLFHALSFLEVNPQLTIGLDGSDDLRARLYHSMFKSNRLYLDEFFIAIGVDWYVRIFRNETYEQDASGNYIAKPRPEPFDYARQNRDLYRYYMFRLK